jgi:hypothetical protein
MSQKSCSGDAAPSVVGEACCGEGGEHLLEADAMKGTDR